MARDEYTEKIHAERMLKRSFKMKNSITLEDIFQMYKELKEKEYDKGYQDGYQDGYNAANDTEDFS